MHAVDITKLFSLLFQNRLNIRQVHAGYMDIRMMMDSSANTSLVLTQHEPIKQTTLSMMCTTKAKLRKAYIEFTSTTKNVNLALYPADEIHVILLNIRYCAQATWSLISRSIGGGIL